MLTTLLCGRIVVEKNAVFWDAAPCRSYRNRCSKEHIASITLMLEEIVSKRLLLQEPHGITSQKAAFFIVIAVKTSHLHNINRLGSVAET
jgi:hypothetical protein